MERDYEEAEDWLEKHPGLGSLPPEHRLTTGESAERDPDHTFMGKHGGKLISLDASPDGTVEALGHALPLWGPARSVQSRVFSNRVQTALQLLPKRQRRLLIQWSRGVSTRELGRRYKVSHEAIRSRLRTAIADFKRVVAEHLGDLLEENDL